MTLIFSHNRVSSLSIYPPLPLLPGSMSWCKMLGEEDTRFAWDVQLDIKEEVKEKNEGVPELYIKKELVENIKDEVVAELFVKEEPFDLSVTENKVCFNSQPCLSNEYSSS